MLSFFLDYFTVLSKIDPIPPNGSTADEWWTGKNLDVNGREALVKLATIPAEIRTEHLPNSCLQRYR
jgi:hypothetical protein